MSLYEIKNHVILEEDRRINIVQVISLRIQHNADEVQQLDVSHLVVIDSSLLDLNQVVSFIFSDEVLA